MQVNDVAGPVKSAGWGFRNARSLLPLFVGSTLVQVLCGQQFGPGDCLTSSTLLASSVFAADLDGDGDQDLLSASRIDSKIAWYENSDGLGTFGPQQVITILANLTESVFAADLDGDSNPDVLSASEGDDRIAWYDNTDGLGTFGPRQTIRSAVVDPYCVFAADLDGDGDQDVLSATYYSGEIAWYENLLAALMADVTGISLATGGVQHFELTAGIHHPNELYLLLGTLGGTSPGLSVDGHVLPLNPDSYFFHTLSIPNSPTHVSTLGNLASNGKASASLKVPPGLNPTLVGSTLHHAYGVFDLTSTPGKPFLSFASNAVSLTLTP